MLILLTLWIVVVAGEGRREECPDYSSGQGFDATETYVLSSDCTTGAVAMTTGSITLTSGASLTIEGTLQLSEMSFLLVDSGSLVRAADVVSRGYSSIVINGGQLIVAGNLYIIESGNVSLLEESELTFPQTGYSMYTIFMQQFGSLMLKDSELVTNGSDENNFSMALNCYDDSHAIFSSSAIYTTDGSWLLGNFYGRSRLTMTNSIDLPTEVYVHEAARISVSDRSSFGSMWLRFNPGSNATVVLPKMNSNGVYDFVFQPSLGFDYTISFVQSYARLSFESFPGSVMDIISDADAAQAPIVFGYFLYEIPLPVTLTGLTVGKNITALFSDSGRTLRLSNVNLNPFTWQVYVGNNQPDRTVVISDSLINEIAVFGNGDVELHDSTLQLAVAMSAGVDSTLRIVRSDVWLQSILAANGGVVILTDCVLHGNFINADGTGSSVTFEGSTIDLRNGDATTTPDCNPIGGYPPNDNGVPLCNPYNPLYACSKVSATNAGSVSPAPMCD